MVCVEGLMAAYSFDKLPFEPEVIEVLKQTLLIALVVMAVIGIPLMATLGTLIRGGLIHVALLIAGGSKQSFATSVRIACYVPPSLTWLMFIPFGSFLLGIWSLIVSIIAVQRAHEVSIGKAVIAVLIPLVVTSLTIGLIAVAFVISLVVMFSVNPGVRS